MKFSRLTPLFPAWISAVFIGATLLLSACVVPTIKSNLTVFHEWPAGNAEKNYAFARAPEQENNLEHKTYESYVRIELTRLGFSEVDPSKAKLHVALGYHIASKNVTVIEPVVWQTPSPYWRGGVLHRWHEPHFGPFSNTTYQERTITMGQQKLKISIAENNGKRLFEAYVNSNTASESLPEIMPYLVRSAFADFPGKNGQPRWVEIDKVK